MTIDPELVAKIAKVRKDLDTNESRAVEHLIRLGLDHYEAESARPTISR